MKIKKIHVVYLLVILFIISLFTIWVVILTNSLTNSWTNSLTNSWTNNVFEGLDVNRTQVITQNKDTTYTVPNTYLDVSPRFVITKQSNGKYKMPYGYYLVSEDATLKQITIAKVPYGSTVDVNGDLKALTNAEIYSGQYLANIGTNKGYDSVDPSTDTKTKFDTNNYDMQYHDDTDQISKETDQTAKNGFWVMDQSGHKVFMPWSETAATNTYYTPGSYPFGPSNYVPNYADSIYLSRTTGESATSQVYDAASMQGGFCSQYKDFPDKLEEICKTVDVDKCGSTSCCVLLGGSKCVAGDENGPKMKANYSDIYVLNKDFYYYQGKCYGNCP